MTSRLSKSLAIGFGVLLMVGVAGAVLYTRTSFGQWSPFTPPDRFEFCGVRYYRAVQDAAPNYPAMLSRAQAMRDDRSAEWKRATTVGLTGWQIYRTSTWPCPEPDDRNGTGHTLYIKVHADRYMQMVDNN